MIYLRVKAEEFGVWDCDLSRCGGFGVWGLRFRVLGLGFRV